MVVRNLTHNYALSVSTASYTFGRIRVATLVRCVVGRGRAEFLLGETLGAGDGSSIVE
jgi:hypothetical protein